MPTFNGIGLNSQAKSQLPHPVRVSSINTYLAHHGYSLSKIIGEGSYSKVRLCLVRDDDGTESRIACKVINKRKASGDFVNKFLPRELQIVSRLRHTNIITVYDVVEFDQNVFIFMDYCNNGDLLEFIKRKGHLSERRSRSYFRQILSAVRYLHSLDLAHRDLKCENVLLTQEDRVKLSDFGFSRYCRDSSTGKRILSNTYCGSAAYAAPEILQGTMYNPKLYDMWSLGCILFIMLTGHMPYDETNIQKMLQNQMERTLTYPYHVACLIPKPPKRLIRHLLEPDVTRRATIDQAAANPWLEGGSLQLLSLEPAREIDAEPGSGDSVNDKLKAVDECGTIDHLKNVNNDVKGIEKTSGDYEQASPPQSSNKIRYSNKALPDPTQENFLKDHVFKRIDDKPKIIASSSGRSPSKRQKDEASGRFSRLGTTSRRNPDVGSFLQETGHDKIPKRHYSRFQKNLP